MNNYHLRRPSLGLLLSLALPACCRIAQRDASQCFKSNTSLSLSLSHEEPICSLDNLPAILTEDVRANSEHLVTASLVTLSLPPNIAKAGESIAIRHFISGIVEKSMGTRIHVFLDLEGNSAELDFGYRASSDRPIPFSLGRTTIIAGDAQKKDSTGVPLAVRTITIVLLVMRQTKTDFARITFSDVKIAIAHP